MSEIDASRWEMRTSIGKGADMMTQLSYQRLYCPSTRLDISSCTSLQAFLKLMVIWQPACEMAGEEGHLIPEAEASSTRTAMATTNTKSAFIFSILFHELIREEHSSDYTKRGEGMRPCINSCPGWRCSAWRNQK